MSTSAREPTGAAVSKEGRSVVFCHSQLRCPSSHFWIIDATLPPPLVPPHRIKPMGCRDVRLYAEGRPATGQRPGPEEDVRPRMD
jgi:hypothetical protein